MEDEKVKLSYSANQLRIRVSFAPSVCMEAEQPPDHVVRRALGKFESEKRAGHIALFKVYGQELRELWNAVRTEMANPQGTEPQEIVFTLGCGAPKLDGMTVEAGDNDKVAYFISFNAPADVVKSWRFDFVRLNVEAKLKALGIDHTGNAAHLFAIWLRATHGEVMHKKAVGMPSKVSDDKKGYSIIVNKARHEVALLIYDKKVFQNRKVVEDIVDQCHANIEKYQDLNKIKLDFLKPGLVDRLKSALRGPEYFGLNLPAVYLVGYGRDQSVVVAAAKSSDASTPAQIPAAVKRPKDYPGKGLLSVSIEQGNMGAMVDGFDMKLYKDERFEVSVEWVQHELHRMGIVFNDEPTLMDGIKLLIEKKESIDGLMVAKGKLPRACKGPYLHESFRDSKVENSTAIDMREMQQRAIVNAGALVAEVRFKEEKIVGKDIFGLDVEPPAGEEASYTVGEGIEQRGAQFFAASDGLPKIENNTISLSQALIHEGDVNLKTGNIRFHGSAEIKGSIDSGSVVEVTGDLIVHGTIRDAVVRVGGNLEAKSGIVTGTKGILRVKCAINAEFIENSRVICGGDVLIRKAILNSNVVAGGSIKTPEASGVIGGGQISTMANIETNKLGFPSGAVTYVFAGVNWRAKLSVDIRQARLDRFTAKNQEDRNALRELTRRKDNQKTKKHEQMIQDLQDRLNRGKTLLEKLKAHLDNAAKNITFDSEAKILVRGNLYTNCRIEVGGVPVPVTNEVIEVMVTSKKMRGTYIHALENSGDGKEKADDKKEAS